MTDFSKYTDKQINEAIFEAKGWTREGTREFEGKQYTLWKNPDPTDYGQYTGAPDDYTRDWRLAGELLEEMKCDVYFYKDPETDEELWALEKRVEWQPGLKRAICEAWLAWKGQG